MAGWLGDEKVAVHVRSNEADVRNARRHYGIDSPAKIASTKWFLRELTLT